jgi:hypothetical protein
MTKQEKEIKAWNTLHTIQCNIEYYLQETNSQQIILPKHALDMIFNYILIKIHESKDLIGNK